MTPSNLALARTYSAGLSATFLAQILNSQCSRLFPWGFLHVVTITTLVVLKPAVNIQLVRVPSSLSHASQMTVNALGSWAMNVLLGIHGL